MKLISLLCARVPLYFVGIKGFFVLAFLNMMLVKLMMCV